MKDKNHILHLIRDSVRATDPQAILILYGSYARGDYDEQSDIDLLILLDKEKITHDDRVRISYPLYDIQFDLGVLISPVVYSKQLWGNKHMITPFYENVSKEGVVL